MRRAFIVLVVIPIFLLIAAKRTGAQEVSPVSTTAEGKARFTRVSATKINYTLTASSINKVSTAHIHLAPRGEDGQVVVNLNVPVTCTVERMSISCRGSSTSANPEGPLAARSLGALLREVRAGRTYVNVNTMDFPDGEIRGQIRAVSTS